MCLVTSGGWVERKLWEELNPKVFVFKNPRESLSTLKPSAGCQRQVNLLAKITLCPKCHLSLSGFLLFLCKLNEFLVKPKGKPGRTRKAKADILGVACQEVTQTSACKAEKSENKQSQGCLVCVECPAGERLAHDVSF